MPAILGKIKIVGVSQGAMVQTGNALALAPTLSERILTGSGSIVHGDHPLSHTLFNATIANDHDVADDDIGKV